MKAIIERPDTSKDAKPRRWQVPVNLVELSRLNSALLVAKQHGVESGLILDGKRLMRTKRAEARLVMVYAACEQRHDPSVWVMCRHELQLDPAVGLMSHLYRAYDEALAEHADENLLNDAQTMKLQLATTQAEKVRLAEEERLRQARLAKRAEQEDNLAHQLMLRRLARCEVDTSRAFRKWSDKGRSAVHTGSISASPPAISAPPQTPDGQSTGTRQLCARPAYCVAAVRCREVSCNVNTRLFRVVQVDKLRRIRWCGHLGIETTSLLH